MSPIIGVTSCRSLADYLKSVENGGAEPLVLDPSADKVSAVLDKMDGLLLTGGVDVDPARYGEKPEASVTAVDAARDEFEIELVEKATAKGLPIFGICRGMQVLNVALGGTLIQDIPSQAPTTIDHARTATPICIAHEVWINKGSVLAGLMPEKLADVDSIDVNSRHHQAVKRIAEGFEVVATAPDGIVEAMENRSMPFCVAVQWHPENFWRTGEFRELFEGFIDATRRT